MEITVDNTFKDVLSSDYNIRTSVHEYGGGAWAILPSGILIFSNATDSKVYIHDVDSNSTKHIVNVDNRRYADFTGHPTQNNLVVAIEEDHSDESNVKNTLILIDLDNPSQPKQIYAGPDFVTTPRFSPNGDTLCFVQWNFPDMPWSGSSLHCAEWRIDAIQDKNSPLSEIILVAGGPGQSCGEPKWSLDGRLYFLLEQHDYKKLFFVDWNNKTEPKLIQLSNMDEVEFGFAEWIISS